MNALNTPKERVEALRKLIVENGLDAYIIPTRDFHQSEYMGDFFQLRRWLSGFTGSAGTLAVTQKEACLWADGRYFVQAEKQLQGTGIKLMKIGQEGVPKLEDYLAKEVPENGKVGFDGRTMSQSAVKDLEKSFKDKGITVVLDRDLAGELWTDRPPLSNKPIFLLDVKYSGKSTEDKLAEVRKTMKEKKADLHILTSLDDIAWLFNLRGGDVECNPVALGYAVVSMDEAILFLNDGALKAEDAEALKKSGVTTKNYHQISDTVIALSEGKTVLLDPGRVNAAICRSLKAEKLVEEDNPSTLAKCIKNPTEIENLIQGHIKDGVAYTKFLYWLKHNVSKGDITEISASEYLHNCRKAQPGFLDNSFSAIVAYMANGAMMHYSATPDDYAVIKPEGFLLVDSGGQYIDGGTTDITRTIVLGPISDQMRTHFTAVTRSMLRLANAKFLEGMKGSNLDVLARGPVWDLDLDYQCGTGHGVGYLLNVHEGPNGFFWNSKTLPDFKEGMVTTDEPGIYLDGEYGIRLENELLCRKGAKNKYGQFMYFQTVTMAPLDIEAINPKQMEGRELEWLNDYHAKVYETLAPFLTADESAWLKEVTRPLKA